MTVERLRELFDKEGKCSSCKEGEKEGCLHWEMLRLFKDCLPDTPLRDLRVLRRSIPFPLDTLEEDDGKEGVLKPPTMF